jgi:formylglycine-generating enzyme required for sulfatase activity
MSAGEARLEELVAQYFAEKERAGELDVEAFAARHPEHAEVLLDVLQGMELMERAAQAFSADDALHALDTLAVLGKARRRLGSGRSMGGDGRGEETRPTSDDFVTRVLEDLESQGTSSRRYSPEGEIARGGQGAVFAVRDETLRRTLAMKVALATTGDMRASTPSDARSLGRFLEEAQVTAQLDHPGIVPVHELGLDLERRVYFTMKLVKGRDLRAIFDLVGRNEEDWTLTRALGVLLRVCEAMAYAHSKGVIHRDLKPSNVMVGKFGEVYVMDWGLARVLGSEDRKDIRILPAMTIELASPRHDASDDLESPLVTMDGDVVGTPAYMPPEQARGDIAAMGPHSDVYGVGAMLYQLLTGQMPYVPSGSRLSNRAVWAQVQGGPPAPVQKLAARIPVELVAICEKAMARDVAARYPDMGALAEDLRAYLEHQVVKAHATGALAELRKWVERNKPLAAALAAVFVAVVGGLLASLVFKARADEHAGSVLRLSALQELEDLTAEADRLWPAHPDNIEPYREWLRKAELLVAAIPEHEARLAELRAKALPRTAADEAQQRASNPMLAELEREKQHLESLHRLAAALQSTDTPRDPEPAEVGLRMAELPATASAVNELAWSRVDPERKKWGEEAKGLVLARLAVELAAELSPPERAEIRDTLAWALFAEGRFEEALQEERKALEEGGADQRPRFEDYLAKLDRTIQEHSGPEGARRAHEVEVRIATLEAEVSARSEWTFADSRNRWWHNQLEKLVLGLKALTDPATGLLSDGTSPDHGWGIKKRLDFARDVEERSVAGSEASARWSEAIASISDPGTSPVYRGLRITPQIGLLPIGPDQDSRLWEFAHLDTGVPATRGTDGQIVLEEETGLVLVLLPGGVFLMGAQATNPSDPNYDPQALGSEGPVHQTTLSPFFLSKYEMTQGQWSRFVGCNPSIQQPPSPASPSLIHPVEQVSWNDCMAVLSRVGLVLPSEAQWEYAARAGTTTPWWTGVERGSLRGKVNLADQAAKRAGYSLWSDIRDWPELDDGYPNHAPVNSFAANPFGLHCVHGNLWELCLDGNEVGGYRPASGVDPVVDPLSSPSRIVRGGGFAYGAFQARSAMRTDAAPTYDAPWVGVRPARKITGEIRYRR